MRAGLHPRFRGLAVAGVLLAGCTDNPGVPAPEDQLFFPAGMIMDPRPEVFDTPPPADGERRRWLFVSNSNSDRNFDGGTVAAVDLDRFWAAWFDEEAGEAYAYCEEPGDCTPPDQKLDDAEDTYCRCVQPPGAPVDGKRPCRHLETTPQVVECDETEFVANSVRVGHFGTRIAASRQKDPTEDKLRLWVPVRSDPSIVYIDVEFKPDTVEFDCDQDADGFCAGKHRLTHLFNDNGNDDQRLSREPFNLLVDEFEPPRDAEGNLVHPEQEGADGYRYVYVTHAGGGAFSRVLIGANEAQRNEIAAKKGAGFDPDEDLPDPEIVEQLGIYTTGGVIPGGFGLATRPCSIADDNVSNLSKDCTRPLVYSSYRFTRFLETFTITPLEDFTQATGLRARATLTAGGLDPGNQFAGPVLGDIGFGDPMGEELYVVQTNPGALLQVDTSLAFDGEPENIPAAPPIEVCQQPTTMAIHDDGVERLAYLACFRSAYIFVVDLNSFRVIASILGGTGPHALTVDAERQVIYASNTLEASLSVLDISRERKTRFTEIARLGLSDPFSR